MATTTKKRQPAKKKSAATKKKPATPATRKPAVKKTQDKKPAAAAKDGSDRIHVKDGEVADVVKQTTITKKKKPKPKPRAARQTESAELTDRELRFCREYVCDVSMNGTQSYLRAFPHVTYFTAKNKAAQMLKRPEIKRAIADMQKDRMERLSCSGDRIIEEAMKLAFYDPRNMFDSDNRIIPVQDLDPDHAAVIEGIETLYKIAGDDNDGMAVTTKIKLPSKRGALEFLAKIKKMTSDATPIQDPRIADVLRKVQSGDVTPLDGAYELQIAGLPLPEVLKIQLSKVKDPGGDDPGDFTPISEEELEKRAAERLAAIQQQRDEFLPERRAEVAEIKERLKDQDSFAPEKFEGE